MPNTLDQKDLVIRGKLIRIAALSSEHHSRVEDPASFIKQLREQKVCADIFTFLPAISATETLSFYSEPEPIAVMKIRPYQEWWTGVINDKTRNMIRKAGKKGVLVEVRQYDDDFVRGIKDIHDECPVRQGKPFRHYGKDFETVKRTNASLLDRSEYIGAFVGSEMVGFLKLIVNGDQASIMQIISKIAHRDKAPTNALVAKAVELCGAKGIKYLQYGVWSRRSLGDFKKHHGFEELHIPRYYVPLTIRGKIGLRCRLHRKTIDYIPGPVMDFYAELRQKWYNTTRLPPRKTCQRPNLLARSVR